jgi:hypothetical protein
MQRIVFFVAVAAVAHAACDDGSSGSAECPLSVLSAPPWTSGVYYDSLVNTSTCKADLVSCAAAFRKFYAGGLTCVSVPNLVPSAGFIVAACCAFIAGVCAMFMPCAPCFCVGKHTPYIASFMSLALHVTLFSLSIDYLLSETCGTSSNARQ